MQIKSSVNIKIDDFINLVSKRVLEKTGIDGAPRIIEGRTAYLMLGPLTKKEQDILSKHYDISSIERFTRNMVNDLKLSPHSFSHMCIKPGSVVAVHFNGEN